MRLTAFLFLTALPAHAADMRDCRLDALSFIDPWAESRFDVTRAGAYSVYACGSEPASIVPADSQTDISNCRGPFGKMALEGTLQDYGSGPKQDVIAVYSITDGLPCCGWSLDEKGAKPDLLADIIWFEPGSAPTLGTQPFASISEAEGTLGGTNPLLALVCSHALP